MKHGPKIFFVNGDKDWVVLEIDGEEGKQRTDTEYNISPSLKTKHYC